MTKLKLAGISALLLALPLLGSPGQAETKQVNWNYITFSSYYVLPTAGVSVSGAGYLPNETVTVSIGPNTQTIVADQTGRFNTISFIIPHSFINSKVPVKATGKTSGRVSTATLKVGTYYPTVEPSSYYLPKGSTIIFRGINFAPDEMVTIKSGGVVVDQIQVNSSGTLLTLPINVGTATGTKTYTFEGGWSKTSYSIKVKIY